MALARPRIFISSTFYDLKHVRADLERFIRELGYEPVMNERGGIPYGHDEKIEEYCYKEIELCEIIVSIVGGNFGSKSQHGDLSISQAELRRAIETDTPAYVFIDRNVKSEYATYSINKDNKTIKYKHVENPETFKFIEFVEGLPKNNIIFTFESTSDIVSILKDQWAGLFQRFLQDRGRLKEFKLVESIETTADTLAQLVQYITDKQQKGPQDVVRAIIFLNHPAFSRVKSLLGVKYRVVFKNKIELEALLDARQFRPIDSDEWDADDTSEYIEKKPEFPKRIIKVNERIFDENGDLREFSGDEWQNDWILLEKIDPKGDDETPF